MHRRPGWGTNDKTLLKAAAAILDEHHRALLGPKLARRYPHGINWMTWRLGFLDEVSITFAKKKRTSPYEVLTQVLESPSSVFEHADELRIVESHRQDRARSILEDRDRHARSVT